jgi:hypothetical protein
VWCAERCDQRGHNLSQRGLLIPRAGMRAFILHRPEWMLDGFPTLVHGLWVLVNGAHAPGEQMLIFPPLVHWDLSGQFGGAHVQ